MVGNGCLVKSANFSWLKSTSPLLHLSQLPLCLKAILPLWQAPQNLPSLFAASVISVLFTFMLNSSSVWQTRQVYFFRCSQWEKETGFIPPLSDTLLIRTLPYSWGGGKGGRLKCASAPAGGREHNKPRRRAIFTVWYGISGSPSAGMPLYRGRRRNIFLGTGRSSNISSRPFSRPKRYPDGTLRSRSRPCVFYGRR